MIFEELGRTAAYETAFLIAAMEDNDLSPGEMGNLSLEIAGKLRSLAIMALVAKSDRELFGQNLTRSGRTRLSFLERLRRDRIAKAYHSASSRIDSLMDALAASDLELARKIVAASRTTWMRKAEYEDDYCYAQLIHRLVLRQNDPVENAALFEQFEKFLDGQASARFDIVRSILNRDQSGFDDAFDQLILERQAKIEEDKERFQLEEPDVMAQRLIFVEGLAILRLATLYGLKTESDYLFCPSIARLTEPVATPEE